MATSCSYLSSNFSLLFAFLSIFVTGDFQNTPAGCQKTSSCIPKPYVCWTKRHPRFSPVLDSRFSKHAFVSTSDFQSEVGEVFGEIGGELPAKFGRRFSSFLCWGKSSEAFSTNTPPQISPSKFTTRFWVVAGPKNCTLPKYEILEGGLIFSETPK